MSLPAIRVAASQPNAAIIFLHGLGDTGEGWLWFPQLCRQQGIISNQDKINWVFPHAPQIPVTVNGGMPMPGWFDVFELGSALLPNGRKDIDGFMKLVEKVKQLVQEQQDKGISPERIIIGGFLQGAALALASLALLNVKVGGVVALSGFVITPNEIKRDHTLVNLNTPTFQGHGTADPVVPFPAGEMARDLFEGLGYKDYTFKAYPGLVHLAGDDELVDVQNFIKRVLG